MNAIDVLHREHGVVVLALQAAPREAEAVGQGLVRTDVLEKLVEFCRVFVDACHHGKEERHLFPRLHELGMSLDSGLLGELLEEHVQGRELVRAIADSLAGAARGEPAAQGALSASLLGYVELLHRHILKENGQLFPQANALLSPEDQEQLLAAFERVEAEETGVGAHERYHAIARELATG